MTTSVKEKINAEVSDGGEFVISATNPYTISFSLMGASDLLFHRWNCEAVEAKSKAAKNSKGKKSDNIESYVWRNEENMLCIPGEYVRQSVIMAAKYKQDPRSPRKSAMDLFKAGVVSLITLASLGVENWDYLDTKRVTIQRQGINRIRPAMKIGWKADMVFTILTPEYIDEHLFYDVLAMAGRLIGIGDFRPTYGRFNVTQYKILE